MKNAIDLRQRWLEDTDSDSYYHVVDSMSIGVSPAPNEWQSPGELKTSVTFEKNKSSKEWQKVMLTHLSELGYVVAINSEVKNGIEYDVWQIIF